MYTTMCDFSDDELDQLFLNVELGEPELNAGNPVPHVRLFATVGSPTDEPVNGANRALAEGGNGEVLARGPPSLPIPLNDTCG